MVDAVSAADGTAGASPPPCVSAGGLCLADGTHHTSSIITHHSRSETMIGVVGAHWGPKKKSHIGGKSGLDPGSSRL